MVASDLLPLLERRNSESFHEYYARHIGLCTSFWVVCTLCTEWDFSTFEYSLPLSVCEFIYILQILKPS